MIGGMGQRRPPMGPSPYTAGRPNPMAGFQGGPPPPRMPPGGGGGVQVANVSGPPPAGPQGPGYAMPLLQGPAGMGGGPGAQQRFGGGYQGSPPWMGGGGGPIQMMDNANAGGLQTGVFDPNMPLAPGVKSYGGGMFSGPAAPPPGGFGGWFNPEGPGGGSMPTVPGVQGMSDAMMHPFAPRNRGPQAVGGGMMLPGGGPGGALRNFQADLAGQLGQGGGGPNPWQRRFPGALQRGIMQAMAPPPQMATPVPPAPYGGQQFRMW